MLVEGCLVPFAEVAGLEKRTLRNSQITGLRPFLRKSN